MECLTAALRERLADLPEIQRGTSVLCLGARLGAECGAFTERGAFSVGVDLNPGEGNPFVVTGDFHDLQFAEASVDCVYTNSLDHVFDLKTVLSEINRVLKPGGLLIAEIVRGSREAGGRDPGQYESCWWENSEDLVMEIAQSGLIPERRASFSEPWEGIQTVFRRVHH